MRSAKLGLVSLMMGAAMAAVPDGFGQVRELAPRPGYTVPKTPKQRKPYRDHVRETMARVAAAEAKRARRRTRPNGASS